MGGRGGEGPELAAEALGQEGATASPACTQPGSGRRPHDPLPW